MNELFNYRKRGVAYEFLQRAKGIHDDGTLSIQMPSVTLLPGSILQIFI
jgi:hypothetical protein